MSLYRIEKEFFKNVTQHQKEKMLEDFELDNNGDILIPYTHKGYTVNNLHIKFRKDVKAISMFSGAGGLDIGTQLAGIKVISSLDIFEDSVETLKKNKFFDHTVHEVGDITKITGNHYAELLEKEKPEKLIIVGGPPCQPFSKAGYWVTNEKRNSNEDPRNMIVPYFRVISELRPAGFVLENVESILHPSNKAAVDTIYENMKSLGYHYSLLKVNAAEYGIPQKRKRVFFLASKKEIKLPPAQTMDTITEIISSINKSSFVMKKVHTPDELLIGLVNLTVMNIVMEKN